MVYKLCSFSIPHFLYLRYIQTDDNIVLKICRDGFIAGVCNPAFANRPSWWDVLCNIETGKIIISKELTVTPLTLRNINLTPLNLNRSTTVASIDESGGIGSSRAGGGGGGINVGDTKAESADNYFMEEVSFRFFSFFFESLLI